MKRILTITMLFLGALMLPANDVILPVSGTIESTIRLGQHKNLAVTIQSTTGSQQAVFVSLVRRHPDGSRARYLRILTVTPETKEYLLPLLDGRDRAKEFRYKKSSKKKRANATVSPLNIGQLLGLSIYPLKGDASGIKVTSLKLTNRTSVLSADQQKVIDKIKALPHLEPYAFKEKLSGQAVSAAGFSIICGKGETEQFAANELAKYLKKITGKDFPVNQKSDKQIILKVVPVKNSENHRAEFSDGKNVFITGESERALLYGVYDFLEKMCGIRFFAPFDYGEVIPENPELNFIPFKDEVKYCMEYRNSHYCSNTKSKKIYSHLWRVADWAVKNRFNRELERLPDRKQIEDFYRKRGGCIWMTVYGGHSYHRHIPPEKYFKTNPDFYCFEQSTGKYRAHRAQLCCTNEKLFKEFGRVGDEYFKKYPYLNMIFLGQEDGKRLWCQCKNCLAITPKGEEYTSMSDRAINLANKAGAEIRKNNPDVIIGAYAYNPSAMPPKIIKPKPYVRVHFCLFRHAVKDGEPYLERYAEPMITWSKLTNGNMLIYSYQYTNPAYVYATPASLAKQFRLMYAIKARATHQEASENWGGLDAWNMYAGARLGADPLLDYEALRKDYYEKFYGSAAAEIMKIMTIFEKALIDPAHGKLNGNYTVPVLSAEECKQVDALLKAAEKKSTKDPRQAQAVNAQRIYFDYQILFSEYMHAVHDYYTSPDQQNFDRVISANEKCSKFASSVEQSRVVNSYTKRSLKKQKAGFNVHWLNTKKDAAFKEQYEILQTVENWKFAIDSKAQGEKKGYANPEFNDKKWKYIKSGNFWEKQGFPGYDGAAWYRAKVTLPYDDCELYFGGADEKAWVYVDGKYVGGHHEGDPGVLYEQPFSVKLNAPKGEHLITVKVVDSSAAGGLYKPVYVVRPKK